MNIQDYYKLAIDHQKSHREDCGALPYAYGELLTKKVESTRTKTILEVGTGIGYSTVCLALGNPDASVHTIDKNPVHIEIAENFFKEFNVDNQVKTYTGTAEDILPTLNIKFDLIFYDGFIPQRKFAFQFYNLLSKGGLLISTNLFLAEKTGGKYLQMISDNAIWTTEVMDDTAFSIKK